MTADGEELLGPHDVRRLLADLALRPSKRRGQNFVVDANTVRRIVRTAELSIDDVVLEIGPGLGSLTLGLLGAVRHVVAVEVEPALAAELPRTVAARTPGLGERLTVVAADALALAEAPQPLPTALVANLPYNVAVPVLLHLLGLLPSVRHGLVMVQAEVGERLAAAPGSRIYGAPSVKAAWWAAVGRAGSVPRTVFHPVPNVDSVLVRLVRHAPPVTAVATREEVFRVVDAAFAQRRKSLRAALAGWAGTAGTAEEVLRLAQVDPAARGETLDVAAFARIADAGIAVRSGG